MQTQSELRYRSDIDGIRAIAVTSVVLFHAGFPPFRSGFLGVDIFFVISGYLIGGIIVRDVSQGRFDFVKFYARRARRILPALFLVVLFTCVAGWLLLDASEYRYVGATATSTLLAVSNFSFWRFQDYFAPDARLKPLLMTWSLGVEEQFYFLFPFLIIFTAKLAAKRIIPVLVTVTLASFTLSVWWSNAYPAAAFYLLPSRAWELGIGAILAAWESIKPGQLATMMQSRLLRETLSWLGLLLVVIGITAFDEFSRYLGAIALVPVIGAACLIATGGSSISDRLLSSRPMVFIGLISYSWYLWHWPLMSYLRIVVPYEPPMWTFAIVTFGSLAVAILSWRFVEQPFRHMQLAAAPTLVRYAAALGVALALPIVVREGNGLPARLPEAAKNVEAVATLGRGGKCLVLDEDAPNLSSECVSSTPDKASVALLGDSHAGALADAFREMARQQNLGFKIFAKSSCRPLLGVGIWSKEYPDLEGSCAAFVTRSLGVLISDPQVKTVFLAGAWAGPLEPDALYRYVDRETPESSLNGVRLLTKGLVNISATLSAAGKKVVLVEDTPQWRFDPFRVELDDTMRFRGNVRNVVFREDAQMESGQVKITNLKETEHTHIIREVMPELPREVGYLDFFRKFCDGDYCTYKDSTGLFFFDDAHLSFNGARHALNGLRLLPAQ